MALIFGISGALRREELVNITVDDVKKVENNLLLVQIPKTKNYVPRSFTITKEFYPFCCKYMERRPENCRIDRFFLRYSKGTCCPQPVGINKFGSMPREIAEYLNLPDPKNFTGHSFRRTSATLLVDAGGDITTLQRHGGWKSTTVAFGYIADSIKNKKRICEQITEGIEIQKRPARIIADMEPEPEPSTSGISVARSAKYANSTAPTSRPSPSQTPSDSNRPKQSCGAYLYHPDIGLYSQNVTGEEGPTPHYTFNHCNITITGPCGNITMNDCTVTRTCTIMDKSVQTDKSGR